jgi:four helix bundle protein
VFRCRPSIAQERVERRPHPLRISRSFATSAVSVMNNIAEDLSGRPRKDFAHFPDRAKGSCGEVHSMLYVAEDLNYITPEQASQIR